VIDQKRIFCFRPKTDIWQENAAEYLADNEYWYKAVNIAKVSICMRGKMVLLGGSCKLQLNGMIYGQ
jgi:hypothetical protein